MPIALIVSLLATLIPTLVTQAERIFGGTKNSGAQKRQWVVDGVHAVLTALNSRLPAWAVPVASVLEPLVDEAIDLALDKLGI